MRQYGVGRLGIGGIVGVLTLALAWSASAQPLRLALPTPNDALLRGDGPGFYQFTNRTFEGRRSYPWQAGQYGYVRNPKRVGRRLVYTRFHEGLDIKPTRRDRQGEPLDPVQAIDHGVVAYVNASASASNYGKYAVVKHLWDGAPFFALYAHLADVNVQEGDVVQPGQRLGRVGYTGRGIDRRRAHVHFEINMLLNERFPEWHDEHFRGANRHGIYNGINMAGLDAASLYLALQEDTLLTIRDFVLEQEPFYSVIVPNEGPLDLLHRYPWLWRNPEAGELTSWEIAFTASGLPVGVLASGRVVMGPTVAYVQDADVPYTDLTSGDLGGSAWDPQLTARGQRYLDLVMLPASQELTPRGIQITW